MDLVTPKPPEEILPLEVWALILDHLTSPFDLINCNQTCKAWEKILELKKTTFLMPKVFPILNEYLETLEYDEEEDEELENGNEEREKPITTILKMRLVSHGWKESVDDYHQNHPELNDIGFMENCDDEDEPFTLLPYHFDGGDWNSVRKLESFLGKGFFTGSNPLITRYVEHHECAQNKQMQSRFQTAFKRFLEEFGSQIWTCNLLCTAENKADFYRVVRSYLRLMPNLRSLRIQISHDWRSKEDSKQEELKLLLENKPLPRLQHLRTLQMNNIPYPLSVGLLTTNKQLQKLSLQKQNDDDDDLLPDYVVDVHLPNLKQLSLICSEMELLQLHKVCWPIKALRLMIPAKEQVLKNIFLTVSSTFSNTLEHFVVNRRDSHHIEELTQITLELPALKILQLDTLCRVETIDFLQGCPALQEIKLYLKVPPIKEHEEYSLNSLLFMDEDDNEVIKFKNCITSMNQSNIWRILKDLQFIIIETEEDKIMVMVGVEALPYLFFEWHKFTRRQFEKFSRTN
ncbi:unnamed protein product [Orchesella dallaii]|uniref:F-box domain-containing protein n=1 Tax=Orchesella dallaii TaxID=48710 RepID=A0ABP1RC94_9HEXA